MSDTPTVGKGNMRMDEKDGKPLARIDLYNSYNEKMFAIIVTGISKGEVSGMGTQIMRLWHRLSTPPIL